MSADYKVNWRRFWLMPRESDILVSILSTSKNSRKQFRLAPVLAVFRKALRSPVFWAIALRVGVFSYLSPIEFRGDAADYENIAVNLANGHGLSRCPVSPYPLTAQRPPLYPFLLSGLYFLGAGNLWASFFLNLAFDLFSLGLARHFAALAGFSSAIARTFAWFVALCPLLIAYAPYPTTENLSAMLFLIASIFLFRLGVACRQDQRSAPRASGRASFLAVSGGLVWGLLALCRSYFLLFPGFLLLIRPSPKWRRRWLALLVASSFIVPATWVARNQAVFGHPTFSQGAGIGWQAYQGLCFTNFDWWNMENVRSVYAHPILSRMLASSCAPDDFLGALDRQVREEVVQKCVVDQPFQAALNVAVKGAMLFINWGQFMPYTEIPAALRWTVNVFLLFYWWSVGWVFWRNRDRGSARGRGDPAVYRFGIAGLVYVTAITIPFAVDARYLLGPFMMTWLAAVGMAGSMGAVTLEGLRACWPFRRPSRRGSRTP